MNNPPKELCDVCGQRIGRFWQQVVLKRKGSDNPETYTLCEACGKRLCAISGEHMQRSTFLLGDIPVDHYEAEEP